MRAFGSGLLGAGALLALAALSGPAQAGPAQAGPPHGAAMGWGGTEPRALPAAAPYAAAPYHEPRAMRAGHPGYGALRAPDRAHALRARHPRQARPLHGHPVRAIEGGVIAAGMPCPPPPVLVGEWCGGFAAPPPGRIAYGRGPSYAAPLYNRPDLLD